MHIYKINSAQHYYILLHIISRVVLSYVYLSLSIFSTIFSHLIRYGYDSIYKLYKRLSCVNHVCFSTLIARFVLRNKKYMHTAKLMPPIVNVSISESRV